MEYVFIAFIAIATVVFVAYPLVGKKRRLYHIEDAFEFGDTRQLNYLTVKKARIEENVRELEFERQMGKLSEEDYTALREGYAKEEGEVAKALDRFKLKEEIENLIENDVRARRRIK
jgi:hypothetical protein